jgi:hypothetical protein
MAGEGEGERRQTLALQADKLAGLEGKLLAK